MMMAIRDESLRYRCPKSTDGARMWRLVKESGKLDLNSSYSYIMLGEWFAGSCRLAEDSLQDNVLAGMVTGFREPSAPETLFVWQIAVDPAYRGRGVGLRLLDELTANSDIRFVEATISPNNLSSRRLFEKWAAARQAPIVISAGFDEACFPDQQHEREELYRIGPLHGDESGK